MQDNEPLEKRAFYLNCQIFRLFYGAARPLNVFDKMYLLSKRLESALVRRIERMKKNDAKKTIIKLQPKRSRGVSLFTSKRRLQVGDLVQVLSREEINKLLNEKNETKGLAFTPVMEKFCGTQGRVMRRVHYVFDEGKHVMRKVNHIVQLEGVICSGEGMFESENCDSACFLFWQEAWLKKISD